ncbi:MAG TPA: S9 family peptidase [Thermoanaerobaculia bacterium]|nr:S9 family peptidase [Thermoanaerobaculia bacterium]
MTHPVKKSIFPFLIMTTLAVSTIAEPAKPPVAKKVPQTLTLHGDERVDEYAWLKDKKSPETIAYLEAENAYAESKMKPTEELQKKLYDEMLGRIKQTDIQVPYRKDGFLYYTRTVEGKQYPIFARKKGNADAAEEVLLDVNHLAEGKKFMSVSSFSVSDDTNQLAYAIDDNGYRQYKLFLKDLRTGKVSPMLAERVDSVEWAKDNKTIFYSTENDAKRSNKIFRHVVGSADHTLLYEEKDELFDIYVERSRSGDYIYLTSDSKRTNEVQLIPASKPEAAPVVMIARKFDLKYYPDHRGNLFYIMTNDAGINYRVVTAKVDDYAQANWKELVAYRKPVRIEAVDLFKDHMVLRLREGGLSQLEIYDLRSDTLKSHRVSFPEPAYAVFPNANAEFDTNTYRYTYQSFITPSSVYDYDLDSKKQTLLKRTEVLGGYDPAKYKVERFFVTATDGAKVPVAMVYRKDIDPKKKNPLLLYAYGSYGSSQPDGFSFNRFSLLDRGMIFALAHIRGGGEMGKEWHEQGRMMTKKNTFTDFIDVADYLVKEGYTSKDKLAISGGSAGGLLMGAVVNMRPDLFKAVMAYVPFVDVINTMLDSSLPLTTQEYMEWGNPNEKDAYFYMKSYDPYGNVEKKAYPTMLVRTSLNDSQVGYWEAAKWVARLRSMKTDENELLLKVNMGAGHGGASGRYDKLREDAHDYAWLLGQLGVK